MNSNKDRKQLSRRKFCHDVLAAGMGVALPSGATQLALPARPADIAAAPGEETEWTFERAQKRWKPMTRAVQHVGVPGHEWQAGVLWDGSLLFGPNAMLKDAGGVYHNPALMQEVKPLGNNLLHMSVGYGNPLRFIDRAGTGNPLVRRWLEEGRLPIPHIATKDRALDWDQVVFAHLLDRNLDQGMRPRREDRLIVHAVFKVRNRGSRKEKAHLWLHFGDTSEVTLGYTAAQGAELGPALPHHFEPPYGKFEDRVRYVIPSPADGSLIWHDEVPAPEDMGNPPQRVIEWEVPLAAGKESTLRLTIPYGPVDLETAQRLLNLDVNAQLARIREFWKAIVESGSGAISVPNGFVNDYAAAVPGQMAQQIGYRHHGALWMYKTSPNWYEAYWPCNAAKALPTLDLRGLTRYTRPVLQSFVEYQSDDVGALTKEIGGKAVVGEGFGRHPGFLGNFRDWTGNTLLLSHGLELWALASHFRITRDRQWLGEGPGSPLAAMLAGCDWIAAQRRRTMRDEDGHKVAHWGLLPAASAHDWFSGNTIFNDSFCIFGMIEVVRLLRETGHARAEELAQELNDYRSCLRARYRVARDKARILPLPDGTTTPYVPRAINELDWTKPDWTYTGYGPLRAGAWGALDPNDKLVDESLKFLEAGMPRGEGYYFQDFQYKDQHGRFIAARNFADVSAPDAARHFLWRNYVEYEVMWPIGFDLFLQRDDLPRFFEWLFNTMAVAVHHDFRVGSESLDGVPSCAPGEGERWRALRDMFVNERGGYDGSQQSLWLLQAIPRCWLRPGDHLTASRMGTHFGGEVELKVEMAQDGNSVKVATNLDLAVAPTEIRMRLRSGDGRPLISAAIDGAATPVLPKDTIRLPGGLKGTYHITGRFA